MVTWAVARFERDQPSDGQKNRCLFPSNFFARNRVYLKRDSVDDADGGDGPVVFVLDCPFTKEGRRQ
jgi:hypothetical protein